jgi:hypothetical protein
MRGHQLSTSRRQFVLGQSGWALSPLLGRQRVEMPKRDDDAPAFMFEPS